jgi:hypothetical protein
VEPSAFPHHRACREPQNLHGARQKDLDLKKCLFLRRRLGSGEVNAGQALE